MSSSSSSAVLSREKEEEGSRSGCILPRGWSRYSRSLEAPGWASMKQGGTALRRGRACIRAGEGKAAVRVMERGRGREPRGSSERSP
jgi:hypothetical protein